MIDRNVEFPNRFRMTKVEGTDDIYDLIPAPGEVIAPGDTFSKANMLPDSIPAALGLKMSNPQVKDALNVLANVGNLHVWQRVQTYSEPVPEVPAGYTLGEVETNKNIVINTYGSDAVWYQTASSVAVDGSGNVSLVAPSSAAYFYVKDLSGAKTLWAGKFVLITNLTNDNQYALPKGTIFFVPSDGNLKSDSNNSIVYVTKYQSVTGYPYTPAIPAGTHVDYLTSTDRNAYTDGTVDNTTITYLGQLGDGARIEVGSYVGTGTYGSSNPNSLTFGFEPKVVIFDSPDAPMMHPVYIEGVSTFGAFKAEDTNYFTEVQVVASGKTISWYNASSYYYQGNVSGATYRYIAIG